MIRSRSIWVGISGRLRLRKFRTYCSRSKHSGESTHNDKVESSVTRYDEAYKQLQNLDFMTATKMLFSEPVKKKKFGFDFHLVQFFFACMPSLAVYLVAQYARHEMRKMDAELEEKKRREEERAKEEELKAAEEQKAMADPDLREVKERLDKLETTVKEIVVESKKQSATGDRTKTQKDTGRGDQPESSDSAGKDNKVRSGEPEGDKVSPSSKQDKKRDRGGSAEDAGRS